MSDTMDLSLEETVAFLTEHAKKQFGNIPAKLIVDQVLKVTQGADFPVRRAALEAFGRRMDNAEREGLHVVESPEGSPWGEYRVARMADKSPGRRRREHRPYVTELNAIDPLSASCSCPDFLKGSLGLCKHALAVLEHWYGSSKRAAQLSRSAVNTRPTTESRLQWNPIWPLSGSSDRLLGISWQGPADGAPTARAIMEGRIEPGILTDPVKREQFIKQAILDTSPTGRKRARVLADAATRTLLQEELAAVAAELRFRHEAERAKPFLKGLKRHLYPYQAEGVLRCLDKGRLLLADDMGLGKTTQAIACCHALYGSGIVKRGLVVTPAALKSQWHREWLQTSDVPVVVVDGSADERRRVYRDTKRGFLIVNYELILRDFVEIAPWAEQLVVLDEAQRIKNYATKSAVYVKALPATRRLVLTGTPMENRLDELASILDWVDDRALAPKWRLPAWYIRFEGDGMKSRCGARNLDDLRGRLSSCLVRRVRAEVLSQLPQRSDTRVPVEMTPEQRDEHDALSDSIKKLASIAEKRPLRQEEFLRLMQLLTTQRMIANGLGQIRFEELWPFLDGRMPSRTLLDSLFAPKLDEFRRLVESLVVDQGRKIVVFSQWRRMLKLADWSVRDLLHPLGHRGLFFTGAESTKLRTQSIVEFHDDPRACILFLSDAGGVGLNLQKAANACINLELPWNPAVLEQRIGRIYRLGQKSPIDVYNLVSERSIESRIASTVGKKQALFKGLFDGTSNEVKFEEGGGFVAEVRKLLDAEQPVAPELPQRESIIPEDDVESPIELEPDGPTALTESSNSKDLSDSVPPQPAVALDPATVLGQLKIQRDEAGGLSIQAPPEVAGTIADLFETMAKLLRRQAS
jgi:hypothetical protein